LENNTGNGQNNYQTTPCHEVDYDRALPIVLGQIFTYGDLFTKLSFLIMGFSNIIRGQIIKGFIFLLTEVMFFYYLLMENGGVYHLGRLITLGTNPASQADGDFGQIVYNDDSRKCLLFGIATIVIIFAFIALWAESLRSGYEAQYFVAKGKRPNSFYRDIQIYFDKKIYRTLLFLPITGVLIFTVLPIIFMICIGFTNYNLEHNGYTRLIDWIGFDMFGKVLHMGSDPDGGVNKFSHTFWTVLGWTLIWAVATTFLCYIFGMILAMVINRKGIKYKKFWRTLFITSVAVPQFVSLLIMRSFLSEFGLLNSVLRNIGISDPPNWLGDSNLAKVVVIIVNLWVGIPYTMLITTGILMNIPAELYEAAKVDGANAVTTFFKITLPYMIFVTTPYLIQQFIGNINNFNVIYLLTGGGPNLDLDKYQAGDTDLLVTWLYKLTMDSKDYNLASVIGILIFILSATFSLITYRSSGSYKNEEEFQ